MIIKISDHIFPETAVGMQQIDFMPVVVYRRMWYTGEK